MAVQQDREDRQDAIAVQSVLPAGAPVRQNPAIREIQLFLGKAHLDALVPLQEWMLERLDQIADIMERQAYPARVGSGFMGLSEEKMAAFGGADTYVFDPLPNAKVEELRPEMPPDMFAEFREITNMFLEASGLTEVMSGRSEQGVRS